jgi:uroporphyrinogen-III decarboxylase
MSWSKRERIEAVFAGERPDRVPVYDILVNTAAVDHYAGEPLRAEGGFETVCKAVGACLDMTRDIFAPYEPGGGTDREGNVWHRDRWSHWIVSRPYDGDPDATAAYVRRDIERLRAVRWDESSRVRHQTEVRRTQSLIGDTVDIFICPNVAVNYAFNVIGMENFCFLLKDDPALTDEWLRTAAGCEQRRVDALADAAHSPVALIYGDVAQKGALTYSPEFLREYLIPDVAAVCDILHAKGMKVVYHSDGDIMSLLPDLAAAGVDGLNPLETAAGMDIRRIKKEFGRTFVLCGGIDVSALMPFGTPDQVREAVRDLIDAAGRDYGLCLGSTTELGDAIPLANVRAMIESAWELGRYPLSR